MESFAARRDAREALLATTTRLVTEFDNIPAGTVIRWVARARERRLLAAGIREGLAEQAEQLARESLSALARPHSVA